MGTGTTWARIKPHLGGVMHHVGWNKTHSRWEEGPHGRKYTLSRWERGPHGEEFNLIYVGKGPAWGGTDPHLGGKMNHMGWNKTPSRWERGPHELE